MSLRHCHVHGAYAGPSPEDLDTSDRDSATADDESRVIVIEEGLYSPLIITLIDQLEV